MNKIEIKCFDKNETRLAEDLKNLGLKTHAAIMLIYLQKVKETSSIDMKERTGLPYPKISLAGRELSHNKWISIREQKRGIYGRPYKIYKLESEMKDIIKYLKDQRYKEVEELFNIAPTEKDVGSKSI